MFVFYFVTFILFVLYFLTIFVNKYEICFGVDYVMSLIYFQYVFKSCLSVTSMAVKSCPPIVFHMDCSIDNEFIFLVLGIMMLSSSFILCPSETFLIEILKLNVLWCARLVQYTKQGIILLMPGTATGRDSRSVTRPRPCMDWD